MVDFTNANSLNMLFLFFAGYVIYFIIKTFEWTTEFVSTQNFLGLFILVVYIFIILNILNQMKSDENLDRNIKLLTKDKLLLETELLKYKINYPK